MRRTNSAERLNYFITFCISILKVLKTRILHHSCILHNSEVYLSCLYIFYKLKRGDLISWGESMLQNRLIICSFILYFNFKSFKDPNSSSFIRFQSILHDSGVLFSDFRKFHKLKTTDTNFLRGTNCAEHLSYLIPRSIIQF